MGERYDLILADPPWWYADMPKKNGGITYPRLKLEELVAMRPMIDGWAGPTCALLMWFTGPHVPTAQALGDAWGFEWVTTGFVWCKTGGQSLDQQRLFTAPEGDGWNTYPGSGRYTKHATEYCGLWRRGSLPPIADRTVRQVIHADVRQHSRKPWELHSRIERLWPQARRLEMFARQRRPGWDAFGNEVEKFGQE